MKMKPTPHHFARIVNFCRGAYSRIAKRCNVDQSYVSRVAAGERKNDQIQLELDREFGKLLNEF